MQMLLMPECVDDYIDDNNPVRIMDAFVASLDLKELGIQRNQPAETGRPAYHPGDVLKLYIYGYMNRIRSSRRLERECARNLEVVWLLGKLRPDFKRLQILERIINQPSKLCFGSLRYFAKSGICMELN